MRVDPEDDEGVVLLAARQPAVVLGVRDTGIGIPDEEKTRVFDAFYQVDSGTTRQAGGTGLGLSIVRRLVEAHQGKVVVEDNVPRGAAFVVTIPLKHMTLS
jgi:signal transduction histidine kinase